MSRRTHQRVATQRPDYPERTCVGCRSRAPQSDLLRFQLSSQAQLVATMGRPGSGRSAYLHRSQQCIKSFEKGKGLVRSLGTTVDRETRRVFVGWLRDTQSVGAELSAGG